MASSGTVD